MTQQVAIKEQGAVAAYDYGQYAGAGFENTTAADFKPSFLRVLQGNSPAIETVPGAKPGLIIDTVTNELFSEVLFIPAVREHVYGSWLPRSEGGGGGAGFGGILKMNDPILVKALKNFKPFERGDDGKLKLPYHEDGEHQLIETVYFHGVQLIGDTMFPATISFSSTGLPIADRWFTIMRKQIIPGTGTPKPLCAHVFKLGSIKKTASGNSWYIFTVGFANGDASKSALAPDSDLFKAGAAVYDSFHSGKVDIDYSQGGAADGGTSDNKADAEIPF